jgi:MFS-type transporter involved in bile tolerance (Atg22 family)
MPLGPTDTVTDDARDRGLRMLLYDGICSQAMGVLTGGAFLVAFALMIGASNKAIGAIAAVGPLAQILQLPAIFLVEKTRLRKALVVVNSFVSRLFWIVIAGLPWFVPEGARVPIFLTALFAYFALGAVSSCSFNSWMRDLVPEAVMGRYFGRRLALATALGAGLSLLAGVAVDGYQRVAEQPIGIYTILFLVGAAFGLLGVFFLARIPEPRMAESHSHGMLRLLSEPFRDPNFRRLLAFLGTWNFAVALAGPFFTVYMLRRLNLSMSWVIALAVASQIVNVLFLRVWGRLADRFTNKSVLSVSGPMFIISIAAWPFTTMPDRWLMTIPILIAIHALSGMSTAGVTLASANIALKAAPRGKATAFLATNALVSGMAATVAPLLGGFAADGFAGRTLSLTLNWRADAAHDEVTSLPAFDLQGLDFLFVISFIFGLYALHRLLGVREEGEVEERVVVTELYAEVRKAVKNVSNVAGLRHLTYFPYAKLRDLLAR